MHNGRAIGTFEQCPSLRRRKAKAGYYGKINCKTPEEIYEALGFNKDESQRQEKAKQQAEDA